MLFDCATPEQSVAQRSVSTTAPQALFFLNSAVVKQQSAALAARLEVEVPDCLEIYEVRCTMAGVKVSKTVHKVGSDVPMIQLGKLTRAAYIALWQSVVDSRA